MELIIVTGIMTMLVWANYENWRIDQLGRKPKIMVKRKLKIKIKERK